MRSYLGTTSVDQAGDKSLNIERVDICIRIHVAIEQHAILELLLISGGIHEGQRERGDIERIENAIAVHIAQKRAAGDGQGRAVAGRAAAAVHRNNAVVYALVVVADVDDAEVAIRPDNRRAGSGWPVA